MCGRYPIFSKKEALEERFKAEMEKPAEYKPRYNAAPRQNLPTILSNDPGLIVLTEWGFTPSWIKPDSKIRPQINARAESIAEKPMFRTSFKNRRCLVLCDGYYEWDRKGEKKIPYRFTLKSDEPFAMAGIWDQIKTEEGERNTYAIITTAANSLNEKIHDRMPVILQTEDEQDWLDSALNIEEAKTLLQPFPATLMKMSPVSLNVNSVKNDSPDLLNSK